MTPLKEPTTKHTRGRNIATRYTGLVWFSYGTGGASGSGDDVDLGECAATSTAPWTRDSTLAKRQHLQPETTPGTYGGRAQYTLATRRIVHNHNRINQIRKIIDPQKLRINPHPAKNPLRPPPEGPQNLTDTTDTGRTPNRHQNRACQVSVGCLSRPEGSWGASSGF